MFARNRKKSGFTLVEVMIAAVIFGIGFSSLLLGQHHTKYIAESSLIRFVNLQYSRGLLEAIQSYDYEEAVSYPHTSDEKSDSSLAFNSHSVVFGAFDNSNSGVCDDLGNLKFALEKERISLRYFPTSEKADATALSPYDISATLQDNIRLIGPEEGDVSAFSDPANGVYLITENQQNLNIFSYEGKGQERAFFFDDVDDFDGYKETREMLPNMDVTFEVSVSGAYSNVNDYQYEVKNSDDSLTGTTITIDQDALAIMEETSVSYLTSLYGTELNTSDNPTQQAELLGYGYYNMMLFKKITIKATWEYPAGSGKINTLIIDGGKVNPRGSVI